MTQVGKLYGSVLYDLAREEELTELFLAQIVVLQDGFRENPEFLRLLSTCRLSGKARCRILDESFRDTLHPYLLNFLKILTQRQEAKHSFDCFQTFEALYRRDSGILSVTAVTAIAMDARQKATLSAKLHTMTGKQIRLTNTVDPAALGGIRLDFDDKRLDATLRHRLDHLAKILRDTAG